MNENLPQAQRFWCALALAMALSACGSGDDAAPGGQAGSSGAGGAVGASGASTGGDGGTGGSATGGDSGTGGSDFQNVGLCAFQGAGVWESGSYSGTHDLILVGDQGVGEDLCVVRFDANTVAEPEVPCMGAGAQEPCSFGTVVELSDPVTVTDVDGACGNSERALDEAGIAARVGERIGMGYAPESTGHGNILVRFDEARMTWVEWGSATFDPDTGDLSYRHNDGVCNYQ